MFNSPLNIEINKNKIIIGEGVYGKEKISGF